MSAAQAATSRGGGACSRRRCLVAGVVFFVFVISSSVAVWATRWFGAAAAPRFSDDRALQFANLAGAAYCTSNDLTTWSCGSKCIEGVSSVHVCDGRTTKAYVALWEERCILSVMGTQEYSAMLTDLEYYKTSVSWEACKGCLVHDGFLAEWNSLESCVLGSLGANNCPSGSELRVTGHSLGAGVGGIAMMALSTKGWKVTEAYTFGMPRSGDEVFAKEFDQRFKAGFFRVTHHKDPIVHIPPSTWVTTWHYQHVEPEVFYEGKVSDGHVMCSVDNDVNCSGKYYNVAYDVFYVSDHLDYMGIQIGTPGCKPHAAGSSHLGGRGHGRAPVPVPAGERPARSL